MESRQMTYGLGSRRPRAVFGVLVPLCVLALVGLGQLRAAAEPEPTEALRAQAARDGQVQVEVRLPDAAATDPAGRQEDLDRAAGDVLFALPDGSYQALPRVTGSASLDLRVDAAGLDALLASPLVAGVSAGGNAAMQRLAAGGSHSLAIKPDGSLWAWGANWYGMLGDGTTTGRLSPVQVLTGFAAVAADYHNLALKTDGSLWAWGYNVAGQIGDGTHEDPLFPFPHPTPVQVLTGVAAVAAGGGHSLAIKTDGSLWAWGFNRWGELGIGTNEYDPHPTPVQVLTGVAAVAAGGVHSLAIKTDGSLWAWGDNDSGQLGDGTTTERDSPVQVLAGVVAVAAGGNDSLAIKTDGTLWAWGENGHGQLGIGTHDDPTGPTVPHPTPVKVLTGVAAVAAGGGYTLAIKTDGSLWAWGDNRYGQLGDGTTTERDSPVQVLTGVAAVAAGYGHTLVLKTDGSLWAWGANWSGQLGDGTMAARSTPVPVTGLNGGGATHQVTATAGAGGAISPASQTVGEGGTATFTVTPDSGYAIGTVSGCGGALVGTIYTTGAITADCAVSATFTALPSYPVTATAGTGGGISPASRSVPQGATTSFTVTPAAGYVIGTVSGCGGTLSGTTYTTGAITAACAVSATFSASTFPASAMQRIAAGATGHSLAIKPDGSLWAWGRNNSGQLGIGTHDQNSHPNPAPVLTGAAAVAAGSLHTLALETDGSLWAWGSNLFGQLGNGTTTDRYSPVPVLTGVAAVASGYFHSLAIKTDGTLWAWGDNNFGELGIGRSDWSAHSTPVQVMTGVTAAAAGGGHTLAIKTDGNLWAWGDNGNGQVGDGTTAERHTPVLVLTGVAAVAASGNHSLALQTNGALWSWGDNGYGQLGDGTTLGHATPVQVLTGVAAVATGGYHTLAIKTNGTLWAWGDNRYGQLGDGSTTNRRSPVQVLSGVVAVAAGSDYTLALKTDGSLWAWGRNNAGQLGDGTTTDRRSPVRVTGFNGNPSYQVTATGGPGGSISPSSRTVPQGTSTTFTLTPNTGYGIGTVSGCGGTLSGSTYTTGLITGACAVRATFAALPKYRVSATVGTGGTISPASRTIAQGATTTFTVTPSPGYGIGTVSGCDGALAGSTYTTGPIIGACAVRATFSALPRYSLTVSKTGTGTVTSAPTGINCGTTCQAAYYSGTSVVLTAKTVTGYQFSGWTNCPNATGTTCTVTLTGATGVGATFSALPRYSLTVSKTGTGTVTSAPAGINCGTTCRAAYYSGTSVVLTAKAATGSQFADWTDCPNPSGTTCTVPVTDARTVQARFVPTYRLTLSKTPAAYGTVTSSPPGITCGTACTTAGAAFPQGTVTLTAQPRPGRSLKGWSGTGAGACTGTDLSCTVPMDAVKSVKVVFQ